MPPKKSPKKSLKNRIAANGYRLCDPLPKGEVLIDSTNNKWILGTPIGLGGFGEIYSCRRSGDRTDEYVLKLDNIDGPLFSEMNFYIRVAKEEAINEFKAKHGLKFLGVPKYIANGIHDKSSTSTNKLNKQNTSNSQQKNKRNAPTLQYRFLVMQRFGDELEKYVSNRRLTAADAADCASKMIDALHYIHTFGYIHADLKMTNILKSNSKSKTSNEWYLVDYGNAERYLLPSGEHRDEKPDKKRANNGTVEYRSRDAHIGLISRRSDIECLAYNLIQWLNGTLPWMTFLKNKQTSASNAVADRVQASKEKSMTNIDPFLRQSFGKSVPNGLKEFFTEVNRTGYKSEPKYDVLKQILLSKVSKSKTIVGKSNDEDSDSEDEDEDESDDEESESESDEEDSSPKRCRNTPKAKSKPNSPQKRKTNRNYGKNSAKDVKVIDLSDSDDDCGQSPPKRSRTQKNGSNVNTIVSPKAGNKKLRNKSLPRYSTPLLMWTSPEESTADDSRRSTRSTAQSDGYGSDVELCRAGIESVETPAMKAMREMIERKKMEKQLNQKKRNKRKL